MSQNLLKCPGCECLFLTQQDLKAHLDRFAKSGHLQEFKQVHENIDDGTADRGNPDYDHSSADRNLRNIENIILSQR